MTRFTTQRTLDDLSEFVACRHRFFSGSIAREVLPWCFPGLSDRALAEQADAIQCTEEFQQVFVIPALQKMLQASSHGVGISGLKELPKDRKFLFIANHRCIVTDAALVSTNMLSSGRGTCKVCLGDNLMAHPEVADALFMVNGLVIQRSGARKQVYDSAQKIARYVNQQIIDKRYSIWLSQSPGRTKDGNDRTDPAIIKMLSLGCGRNRAGFESLNIVPVAVSYEYEPCATQKVRETLMRRDHGHYHKTANEDVEQIRSSMTRQKGRVHLAFGQQINLANTDPENIIQDVVDTIDAQIWAMYRTWPSNIVADAALHGREDELASSYAQRFLSLIDMQVQELQGMGFPPDTARRALLELYASPIANARRVQELIA